MPETQATMHADQPIAADDKHSPFSAPQLVIPKGGGAIRGIGEKFAANPVTGTGSMTVPIATSPGRSGFSPQLALAYDSGAGNGPFGFGWSLSLPSITRKTDKGLPRYDDGEESDVFILSGAEDLVPVLVDHNGQWVRQSSDSPASEPGYRIQTYRPRIEGMFARIERWTDQKTGISHWRSISKDNITTLYGKRNDARIADPADPARIFSWLICESHDDKGNAILYGYKPEDDVNVDPAAPCEQNRRIAKQYPQRYLKTIRYGNRTPREANEDLTLRDDWLFEAVFDYGEHDEAKPTTKESEPWPVRLDPFSRFRSTFDVRTWRLCRRVLIFHHFPDELGGTADTLVRSTDLEYKEGSIASFISSVTQAGYTQQPDRSYLRKALPKLEFKYTEVRVDETVHEIDPESVRNLPVGVDGMRYRWVDLDSEGLDGVLSEQADAWYYKRNLGNGTFGAAELVAPRPIPSALTGGQQLLDLAGEGQLDLVQFDGPMAGFSERTAEGGWEPFTRFKSLPTIDTRNPNLRFVDITGDGHADILVSEDTVFTWYESHAKEGFGAAHRTVKAWDEEKGPKIVFSDPTQSIFLSDMSGDGLADIVRIRYDEVCYWPNLGYGRFGAKVAMGHVPIFDSPDLFDPRRIHLADIDGSGTTDILYIGQSGISLCFNQSGNFWSAPQPLSHFPKLDSLKSIAVTDLLGNGTACLVWSSPLAADARQPMRYIDLMGGQKPHLLIHTTNNMGAETEVQYTASTRFYLQDRREGRPWVTKLPFPVHVITRVESRDLVSNTQLVNSYRYRHGYFDGVEREFRGFAYVEQRDVESVAGEFDLPPIVTKTWFHTGALLEGDKLEAYFKDPNSKEYFTGDLQAVFLPDTELPPDLTYDEMREAARALKGSILRQEVYADDDTPRAELPYSVSERSYQLTGLQPRGPNRHAVFFSHPAETLDYHYERNPGDPRISHALTLEVDDYGNVLKSVAIGYPRRAPAFDEQKKVLATLTESQVTNAVREVDAYRTPLPFDSKTYELTAPTLRGAKPLDFAVIEQIAAQAAEIAYEMPPTPGQTEKRLIEQARTLYRKNDLSALLPTGKIESMALPGESYKLALTPGLLDSFQSKASRGELINILTGAEGQYRNLDGSNLYWIPSGRVFYSPTAGDSAQQELPFARAHFFLPHRFQDPFGNHTVVAYDGKYNLLPIYTRDAASNETMAEQDYRVLQPKRITDPNGNRTEARFDALGMLAGTAVRGKATGAIEGDSFDDFNADLAPAEIKAFFDAPDPRALAVTQLGSATTRIVYDLARVPVCAASIARETHVSDLAPDQQTKVQLHFVYSDGFGREAQTRVQAEPGPLDPNDAGSPTLDPRWVGTGTKVYNNKGNPVRQYEPFFSATPAFGIEKHGVSSTLFYDAMERVVATLHPNHTFEKVVFDPWQQTSWDVNDTVTFDPKTDPDAGEFFSHLPDADYLPTWYQQRINGGKGPDEKTAADKAALHADTPTVAHFDTLGRPFLTIADNGKDAGGNAQQYRTRVVLDIEGNQREVIDALDRIVMRYDYDMLGNRIHQLSMEAGGRWMLNDVAGKPIRAWDSRGHNFTTTYDALRRPLEQTVRGTTPDSDPRTLNHAILIDKVEYGESLAHAEALNLRTRIYRHFDSAGVATNARLDANGTPIEAYDFKGNLLRSTRRLVSDYKDIPDWQLPAEPQLDAEFFEASTRYDALNRPVQSVAPHSSLTRAQHPNKINVIQPVFNEANLLERVDVWLERAAEPAALLDPNNEAPSPVGVANIDYDAKGQRQRIDYKNGASTVYDYDPLTFRLTQLLTRRNAAAFPGDDPQPPAADWPGKQVQNLHYTYDPAGNITHIRDDAQQTLYFKNQRVEPSNDYTYDALYRLIHASGREHLGQNGAPIPHLHDDAGRVGLPQPGDGNAMGTYLERYVYDAVGNFLQMQHRGSDPANAGWTRAYDYLEASLVEDGSGGTSLKTSNRLTRTTLNPAGNTPQPEAYQHDAHGNMVHMPHLGGGQPGPNMHWDYKDQLRQTDLGGGGVAWYVYDASGQRVCKVWEKAPGFTEERLYLSGFEIFRKHGDSIGANTATLERETLHVMDDQQRIALVETRTLDTAGNDQARRQLIRYQFGNHLGSASLELDDQAKIISYEEYAPYGSSTYQAVRNQTETAKRYRYTGKERDEESGLYYYEARYYAAWLGRWTSCDPQGLIDGPNSYSYVHGNPIRITDPSGCQAKVDVPLVSIIPFRGSRPSPPEEGSSRGIYAADRKKVAELLKRYGDSQTKFDIDHMDPFVTSPPGSPQTFRVRPSSHAENPHLSPHASTNRGEAHLARSRAAQNRQQLNWRDPESPHYARPVKRKVKAPKGEVPTVEAPKGEAPTVEAPKGEVPKFEAPRTRSGALKSIGGTALVAVGGGLAAKGFYDAVSHGDVPNAVVEGTSFASSGLLVGGGAAGSAALGTAGTILAIPVAAYGLGKGALDAGSSDLAASAGAAWDGPDAKGPTVTGAVAAGATAIVTGPYFVVKGVVNSARGASNWLGSVVHRWTN